MCRSFLLSGAFILVLSRTSFADKTLNCTLPLNFSVDISDRESVLFYQPDLTVDVDKNSLSVISYPGVNSVNVHANNVIVTFKGMMAVQDRATQILTQPQRITQTYTDRISGIAERIPQPNYQENSVGMKSRRSLNSVDANIHDCRLVLLPTDAERASVPARVANEIRRLAESCVELDLCQRLGRITPQHVEGELSRSGLLSVYANPLEMTGPQSANNQPDTSGLGLTQGTVQAAINKLVDLALAEIIEKLREKNEGTIDVPNILKEFSTGSGIFETTGRFEAVEGRLRDLTTIRRVNDVILTHTGMKFVASCSFGLSVLNLNYDRYMLKYGIIKVNGKVSGDIDGMVLTASASADYTQTPCRVVLESLEVAEMGKMKIHITGLSPLNSLVSKLLSWITKNWNEEIVDTLEKKLRKSVQAKLSTFNCERFRP